MATQVQIRGAAQATQEARTLVSRELDVNTTDNRISIHNGSFSGGIRHVNMYDQQNNEFNYASASGTNALTASMRIAPSSYVTGQVFWIKIANTNTGSVTLNINSLGAKTVKKVFNNALTTLSANDLISGQMIGVLYDGTDFQIVSGSGSEAGKQAWVPTGDIASYTASDCVYVDYGDSVTVMFRVVGLGDGSGAANPQITNLPFSSEYPVDFIVSSSVAYSESHGALSNYHGDAQFIARLSSTTISITQTSQSGNSTFFGTVTYIKN